MTNIVKDSGVLSLGEKCSMADTGVTACQLLVTLAPIAWTNPILAAGVGLALLGSIFLGRHIMKKHGEAKATEQTVLPSLVQDNAPVQRPHADFGFSVSLGTSILAISLGSGRLLLIEDATPVLNGTTGGPTFSNFVR